MTMAINSPSFSLNIAASAAVPPPLFHNLHYITTASTTNDYVIIHNRNKNRRRRRRRSAPQAITRVSSDNQTISVSSPTAAGDVESPQSVFDTDSASDVVKNFYTGINGHDLASVEDLIAEDCVYEDLIFSRPFVGRKAILEFFKKFIDSISTDLQFVIDDISNEDSSAVGVTWHLEWKGKPFPFSKGCSFYRLEVVNGKKQIIYGRDSVEPSIKPGETALVAIRGVTWLLQQFPQLADQL